MCQREVERKVENLLLRRLITVKVELNPLQTHEQYSEAMEEVPSATVT